MQTPQNFNPWTVTKAALIVLFSLFSFFAAFTFTSINQMPKEYVLKSDYNRDMNRFESKLDMILDKVDRKADK